MEPVTFILSRTWIRNTPRRPPGGNDSKMDYKYRDVGKLLWLQVDRVLQILSSLEKCRSGLIQVFENVKELYKTKEYPVGVSFAEDSRLSPISSRTVLSPVSTSISSRIFSSFPLSRSFH